MSITNIMLSGASKTYMVCETDFLGVRPRVVCKDGFKISIQAGRGYSCTPENDDGPYTHVELGYPEYPSKLILRMIKMVGIPISEPTIKTYAVNKNRLEETIYKQVPVAAVDRLLAEHGGLIGFEIYADDDPGCTCTEGGEPCLYCQAAAIL